MNIYDFTLEELESYLVSNGFKKYNATQIIEWMYEKEVYDFNKMTNLSKKLISFLCEKFYFGSLKVLEVEKSKLANKYLVDWNINRLSKVDKAILSIGIYELMYTDTPSVVAINEAIELSKKYSDEKVTKMLNATLDKIYHNEDTNEQ